ncbi:MAG TPA: hypothetical protein VGK52_15310 [Polyangia bacterium]|jgi:hypothetical protein
MRTLAIAMALSAYLPALDGVAAPLSKKEEVACRDVPEGQRDAAILTNPESIRSVAEIKREHETGASPRGARIALTAAPGMTVEGLQRIADCHMAELAALGSAPRATRSPLDVAGASVTVNPAGAAFTVDITSPDPRKARAILVRARALLPRRARKH